MANGTKVRGVLLVVLGVGLAIGMWAISEEARRSIPLPPEGSPLGTRAPRPDEQGQTALALFAFLGAFGVSCAVYGIYMAVTGRQSLVVRILAGLLLVALIVASLFVAGWPPPGLG